jgi:hypothetical protein
MNSLTLLTSCSPPNTLRAARRPVAFAKACYLSATDGVRRLMGQFTYFLQSQATVLLFPAVRISSLCPLEQRLPLLNFAVDGGNADRYPR